MTDQDQSAKHANFITTIGDHTVSRRADGRAFRNADIEAIIDFAATLAAECGKDGAIHRPLKPSRETGRRGNCRIWSDRFPPIRGFFGNRTVGQCWLTTRYNIVNIQIEGGRPLFNAQIGRIAGRSGRQQQFLTNAQNIRLFQSIERDDVAP